MLPVLWVGSLLEPLMLNHARFRCCMLLSVLWVGFLQEEVGCIRY